MADKVTIMEVKVDLQCPRCYRKIKKVLCKFPEIRDQMYDEKQNKVTIKVVTCCPEFILKRIKSKGGRSVDSIDIVSDKKKDAAADKPKDAEKKKDAGADKPKDAEKKKDAGADKPKDAEKKKDAGADKPKGAAEKKPEAQVHKDVFGPVSGVPTIYPGPGGVFYDQLPYYPGYGGVPMPTPCYHGHGMPCMCYGVPAYQGYVGNRGGTGSFDYFSEENPEACMIM